MRINVFFKRLVNLFFSGKKFWSSLRIYLFLLSAKDSVLDLLL